MSKLLEYKTLVEKEKFFHQGDVRIVVNVDKIFGMLEERANTGDFIFRGCCEARYMMFNSAQRVYINQELFKQAGRNEVDSHYHNFVANLIEECRHWNKSTVANMFKAAKIDEDNSLAYLSYMQHYGIPTPFLDFTTDPYYALFFAVDGVKYIPSDNEIDNYFSIYFTYHNATIFESWKHTFKTIVGGGTVTYDKVSKNEVGIILPDNPLYSILNNTNIVNQKGLFFYNNHPFYSLEERYFEFAKLVKAKLGQQKFDEMLMHDTIGGCYNIHKSLITYVVEKLERKGINRDFLFPDIHKMNAEVTKNAIANSICGNK